MDVQNPYQTPTAPVAADDTGATYQPRLFALSGRIGRWRYLAYSMTGPILAMMLAMLPAIAVQALGLNTLGMILLAMGMAAVMVYALSITVRRLNDMDMSGRMCLLMIVPLANIAMWLLLVLKGGSAGANRYGLPPGPNSIGVIIAALIFPFGIGILAAISIPAYQNYVHRAHAAQAAHALQEPSAGAPTF